MTQNELFENLLSIKQRIESAKKDPQQRVYLLAVSKGQTLEQIRKAYDLGLRDFGENYVQELKEKQEALADLPQIRWHFLGRIQSNKIKDLMHVDVIHSLSEVRHAAEFEKRTPKKAIRAFMQVDFGSNPDRLGVAPKDVLARYRALSQFKSIELVGLMTILPLDPTKTHAEWFQEMQNLRQLLLANGFPQVLLSMGMSDDFEDAILAGSDVVRIGSLLFGARASEQ